MEFNIGEKSSLSHKMFEKDGHYGLGQEEVDDTHDVLGRHEAVGQASNFVMGNYIPQEAATAFRGYGADPIQDTRGGEHHGNKVYAAKGHYWTREEDLSLLQHMEQHGNKAWSNIAKELPGRTGKQCRERWINHLEPTIMRTPWTEDEERALVKWHKKLGKKWAKITTHITGRPENSIKNQWYATERSVEAKIKHKREDTHPGVLEKYIRGLKKGMATQSIPTGPVHTAGTGTSHKVTMPLFAASGFAGSSQVPVSGSNPLPLSSSFPELNGDDDFPMEATYEDSLTVIPTQESGYLNDDDDFPMEATYKDSLIPAPETGYLPYMPGPGHQFGSTGDYLASGYSIQPQQLPQYPISVQQEQAFFNYHAAEEDPVGQVFAGRYYHNAGHDQSAARSRSLLPLFVGTSHYDKKRRRQRQPHQRILKSWRK